MSVLAGEGSAGPSSLPPSAAAPRPHRRPGLSAMKLTASSLPAILAVTLSLSVAFLAQPGYALTAACRDAVDSMFQDDNYVHVNRTATALCKLTLENDAMTCCSGNVNFVRGLGDGCGTCEVACRNQNVVDFCDGLGGRHCLVTRTPFPAGMSTVSVSESFCAPPACDNTGDLAEIVPFVDLTFVDLRSHWRVSYENGSIACDSSSAAAISIVVIMAVLCVVLGTAWYCLVPPRGRKTSPAAAHNAPQFSRSDFRARELQLGE